MFVTTKKLGVEMVPIIAAGVGGAIVLFPGALPLLGRVLRPFAKEVIKACHATGDLVAQARRELEQENAARTSSEAIDEAISEDLDFVSEARTDLSEVTENLIIEVCSESEQNGAPSSEATTGSSSQGTTEERPGKRGARPRAHKRRLPNALVIIGDDQHRAT